MESGIIGSEMLQRRLAQRVGKLRIVDSARQQQCANHRGHGNERMLVRAKEQGEHAVAKLP